MRNLAISLLLCVTTAWLGAASQAPSPTVTPFEVSSIKRNVAGGFITIDVQPNGASSSTTRRCPT